MQGAKTFVTAAVTECEDLKQLCDTVLDCKAVPQALGRAIGVFVRIGACDRKTVEDVVDDARESGLAEGVFSEEEIVSNFNSFLKSF